MTCEKCKQFDEDGQIFYYKWGDVDIGIVACREHFLEVRSALNGSQEALEKMKRDVDEIQKKLITQHTSNVKKGLATQIGNSIGVESQLSNPIVLQGQMMTPYTSQCHDAPTLMDANTGVIICAGCRLECKVNSS